MNLNRKVFGVPVIRLLWISSLALLGLLYAAFFRDTMSINP